LMKMMAGRITPTSGKISIDGKPISPMMAAGLVSYVEAGMKYFNYKVSVLLDLASKIQSGFDREYALSLCRLFQLDINKKYNHLSLGTKTLLTTIIAMATTSRVALLDEPTLGLDVCAREKLNELLLESYTSHPRLIIVSTNLMQEIPIIAERLIIIEAGRILMEIGIDDLGEKGYSLTGPSALVKPLLKDLNCIGKKKANGLLVANIFDERISPPDGVSIGHLSPQDFFDNIV